MDSISVITPVYNDPRVQRCLDSILAQQDTPPVEMIVVDGESDDETRDILDSFDDKIDTLVREPDNGIYDAMNKGIKSATGDVVGILNADDRYSDRYVLRDIWHRLTETGADACYGDLVCVNADDEVVRYCKPGMFERRRMRLGWMPPHPTLFVSRNVYEDYGLFDTSLEIAADYELMLRLLIKHRIDITYLDRVVIKMATGGKSNESVSSVIQGNIEVYQAWRQNGLRGGKIVPFCKLLRRVPQFIQRPERRP